MGRARHHREHRVFRNRCLHGDDADQRARGAAGIGGCTACIGLAVGSCKFGAQFGVGGRAVADIGADEVGLVGIGFVVDCGRRNLQFLVGRLPFDAATRIVDAFADAILTLDSAMPKSSAKSA